MAVAACQYCRQLMTLVKHAGGYDFMCQTCNPRVDVRSISVDRKKKNATDTDK